LLFQDGEQGIVQQSQRDHENTPKKEHNPLKLLSLSCFSIFPPPKNIKEEVADILAFTFLLVDLYGFDVKKIILDKIRKNAEKFPVDKAKGNAKKYNEL